MAKVHKVRKTFGAAVTDAQGADVVKYLAAIPGAEKWFESGAARWSRSSQGSAPAWRVRILGGLSSLILGDPWKAWGASTKLPGAYWRGVRAAEGAALEMLLAA